MSFLSGLVVGNDINLDLIERNIARFVYEKLKWAVVDFHHPIHIIRNNEDYGKWVFSLATAVVEKECKEIVNRLIINVFTKLTGETPWHESNRKKEKHLRRKDK